MASVRGRRPEVYIFLHLVVCRGKPAQCMHGYMIPTTSGVPQSAHGLRKRCMKSCYKGLCPRAQHMRTAQASKEIPWTIGRLDSGSNAVSKGQKQGLSSNRLCWGGGAEAGPRESAGEATR